VIELQEEVAKNVCERRLFRSGEPILVAVSGGVDSMVLLRLLQKLSIEPDWKLTVAHVNHQLRGRSSLADERFVRHAAEAYGVPCVVERVDVRGCSQKHGVSLEMAARRLRHDFLARTAIERGISTIAMAHHRDDQVELFLLRLFRGGGSGGLAGMNWSSASPSDARVRLVRPLLGCSKRALLAYAAENKVAFHEDSTNASVNIQRNRIRHKLLPLLRQEYQPAVDENILRVMEILGAESAFLREVAEAWLQARLGWRAIRKTRAKLGGISAGHLIWGGEFANLPVPIQRRCLQLQIEKLGWAPDFGLVEHLRREPNQPIEVSRDSDFFAAQGANRAHPVVVRLVSENGRVRPMAKPVAAFLPGAVTVDLGKTGAIDWHGVSLKWELRRKKGQKLPPRSARREFFDADKVGRQVRVRHWRPGDRFQPIGMPHAVKLQDLFVNQKVPMERRRQLLVGVSASGELFWVEDLRVSERFKLTGQTIRRLQWRWQRH
jgi:tRNA(Ile)-lysidine synthase